MNVVLQPCANDVARKHYQNTVQQPVKLADIAEFLGELRQGLEQLFPNGRAPIWGILPDKKGKASKYKRLQKGDKILFAREKAFFASATLMGKLHSKELAQRLWGKDEKGQTWEYIYFLDELRNESISYEDFNRVVGYSRGYPAGRGFNVLDETKSQKAIAAFELESNRYFSHVSKKAFDEAVADRFIHSDTLDSKAWTNKRKEQDYLRDMVLRGESFSSQCAICGNEYPIDLLVAAHIKKRSVCTLEERKDARNIVMAVCKLGCDELYEKGYITVGEDGCINPISKKTTPVLADFLQGLKGKSCSAFRVDTAKYFAWHRKRFGEMI